MSNDLLSLIGDLSQCCKCLFIYSALYLSVCMCLSFFLFLFLQMAVHTHGGSAEVMKSTSIGVVLHLELKNVPVESNAIAQTPNTTATVMLITNSGE